MMNRNGKPPHSRRKGARGETEFIKKLNEHWPEACRNLDQFGSSKADVLNIKGVHWQIKRVGRNIQIWAALQQAENEAAAFDLPVVAFRRDHGQWYAALPADELIALLRLRET
jgi:hypothetical protein